MAGQTQTYGQGTIDLLNARLALATKERDALAALCSPDGLERLKAELAGVAALRAENDQLKARLQEYTDVGDALRAQLEAATRRLDAYEALAEQMGVDKPGVSALADSDPYAGSLLDPEGPKTTSDTLPSAASGSATGLGPLPKRSDKKHK